MKKDINISITKDEPVKDRSKLYKWFIVGALVVGLIAVSLYSSYRSYHLGFDKGSEAVCKVKNK